jgi:hypothetical protein
VHAGGPNTNNNFMKIMHPYAIYAAVCSSAIGTIENYVQGRASNVWSNFPLFTMKDNILCYGTFLCSKRLGG